MMGSEPKVLNTQMWGIEDLVKEQVVVVPCAVVSLHNRLALGSGLLLRVQEESALESSKAGARRVWWSTAHGVPAGSAGEQ